MDEMCRSSPGDRNFNESIECRTSGDDRSMMLEIPNRCNIVISNSLRRAVIGACNSKNRRGILRA